MGDPALPFEDVRFAYKEREAEMIVDPAGIDEMSNFNRPRDSLFIPLYVHCSAAISSVFPEGVVGMISLTTASIPLAPGWRVTQVCAEINPMAKRQTKRGKSFFIE